MNKRLISFLLCLMMLLGLALPCFATEDTETGEEAEVLIPDLRLRSADDFLKFAENCRLDSYSTDLVVSLEESIDLSGLDFDGIPLFCGTFLGNGNTISGLSITAEGSALGLFRYLTETALVQELNVVGTVAPGGSRNQVGGIVGHNSGILRDCGFNGSVSGSDQVGGLAGVNTITGLIENCLIQGEIFGSHSVGGAAGDNSGVIRDTTNRSQINITAQQNTVRISDITLDTLTNSEAANTVTDIGGIAGKSTGVVRGCTNLANVGYRHIGYNIGGIVGTQSGYVVDSHNYGQIHGRKEVGGIVGQMEPATLIEYTQDTLQILQNQLGTMTGMVNKASSNAQANASQIAGQIGVLRDKAETASDAVKSLFKGEIPDPDAITAARNTLSSTIASMPATMNGITAAAKTTLNGLSSDLQATSGHISAMSHTINSAKENLGAILNDVSDFDTEELVSGKVEACQNYGSILADYNAGGVCGAIAVANDLDFLENLETEGTASLNIESEIRAVILRSENHGTVTAKKQNVGGIVGWQALGLVRNCSNAGTVDGTGATFVGGVSGLSNGFIRSSNARCEIMGNVSVGGIAGSAPVVTDSFAMVRLPQDTEKLGAIVGNLRNDSSQQEAPVFGNYYFSVDFDPGAIDGISYSEKAQGMPQEEFLALEQLPEVFRKVTIRFLYGDGSGKQISVEPGGKLSPDQIPEVPEKKGHTGRWDGLEDADLSYIPFDMTFLAVYTPHSITIESEQTRESGLPLLLAQGAFTDEGSVSAEAAQLTVNNETVLEGWNVVLTGVSEVSTIRLHASETMALDALKVLVQDSEGSWKEVEHTTEGRYIIIPWSAQDVSVAICQGETSNHIPVIVAVCAAAALLAGILFLRKKKSSTK